MSGDLEIKKNSDVNLWLHYSDVKRARIWLGNDSRLRWSDQGGEEIFSVGSGGDVSTKQFGDLNNRIEARGQAWGEWGRNQCITSTRFAYLSDLDITHAINGGMQELWGAGVVTGRSSIVSGDGADVILRAMRFRQFQQYFANQGWVASYNA